LVPVPNQRVEGLATVLQIDEGAVETLSISALSENIQFIVLRLGAPAAARASRHNGPSIAFSPWAKIGGQLDIAILVSGGNAHTENLSAQETLIRLYRPVIRQKRCVRWSGCARDLQRTSSAVCDSCIARSTCASPSSPATGTLGISQLRAGKNGCGSVGVGRGQELRPAIALLNQAAPRAV
jgi:hypothetical protein